MNLPSDIERSEFAYIYVQPENTFVAWNLYRGVISTDELNQLGFISFFFARMLMKSPESALARVEADFEKVRLRQFKDKPSRLRSIYAFPSIEAAEIGVADMRLGSGFLVGIRPSNFDYICFDLDSNWRNKAQDEPHRTTEYAERYWNGERTEKPIVELLLNGNFLVHGRKVRKKAYDTVKASEPTSLWMLEIARLAAHFGMKFGMISAFLNESEGVQFLIRSDAEEAAEVYRLALEEKRKDPRFEINFEDISIFFNNEYTKILDLRNLNRATPDHVITSLLQLTKRLSQ